ncbi:efflux pumps conferring antibiotic resistance [compost metagenome]
MPLILATGAGAVSRFDIGTVIATGMSVGTLFTLFVLPCIYTLLAKADAPQVNAGLTRDEVLPE